MTESHTLCSSYHPTLGSDSLSALPCDVLDLPHLEGLKLARKDFELVPLFLLLSLPAINDISSVACLLFIALTTIRMIKQF